MGLFSLNDLLYPFESLEILKYDRLQKKAEKEAAAIRKKLAEEEERKATEAKLKTVMEPEDDEDDYEDDIERVDGEIVEPTALTNIIFNPKANRYEFTIAKPDQSMFFSDGSEIPLVEDLPELSSDDIENIITYVVKDVKKIDNSIKNHTIRNAVLAVLYMTDAINIYQMSDHFDPKAKETDLEINAIGFYLTNFKIFVSVDVHELEQFITVDQLKLIVDSLSTKLNWTGNQDYIDIVKAVKEGFRNIKAENKKEKQFPVVNDPILQETVDYADNGIINVKEPKIDHKVFEYLVFRFSEILKDCDNFMFSIFPAIDNKDPAYNARDIAQAIIKCTNMQDGSYCLFSIDLNTIVGNGFNLIVPSVFKDIMQDVYINIDKHPDIVKKVLTTNHSYGFNQSNLSDMELKTLTGEYMSPYTYRFFDFSGMYKHINTILKEDMVKLETNLVAITHLGWNNIGMQVPPRFRFRDYKSPDTFILVSDKNVRVQSSNWMANPYGLYAKQFITGEPNYESANAEIVVDLEGNEIKIYMDKQEVNL